MLVAEEAGVASLLAADDPSLNEEDAEVAKVTEGVAAASTSPTPSPQPAPPAAPRRPQAEAVRRSPYSFRIRS